MENSLIYNSYHVLGLPIESSQRDIIKRGKDIQKLLEISEVSKYDTDLMAAQKIRSDQTVKDALQELANPKKRIKEYFFWFSFRDENDVAALKSILEKDFTGAIKIWSNSVSSEAASLNYKKNLAILYCCLLLNEGIQHTSYFSKSLHLWKEVLDADTFWKDFYKNFKKYDDLNTDSSLLEEFKKSAPGYLADVYSEMSKKHSDNNYFSEFTALFKVKGEKAISEIVTPLYNAIFEDIAKLSRIDIVGNKNAPESLFDDVKNVIKQIQSNLNKVIDLGIYEDSESKNIRDKAAEAIHHLVTEIYNNDLDFGEKSSTLIDIALKIAGTTGVKDRLTGESNVLKKNLKYRQTFQSIEALSRAEKFDEALQEIDSNLSANPNDQDLQKAFLQRKRVTLTLYAFTLYQRGEEQLKKNQYTNAQNLYAMAGSIINTNLGLFERFNVEGVKGILKDVNKLVYNARKKNLSNIDKWRNDFYKQIDGLWDENSIERDTLKGLVNSYLMGGLVPLFKRIRDDNKIGNGFIVVGWITVWFYGIGIIFWIIGWYIKNRN